MGNIKNEYKSFLDDIEKNIKNKKDLEYINKRFTEFVDNMLDRMDYIIKYKKDEKNELQEKQKQIEDKMEKMQGVLNNIERDIYADEGFDFEIVCPYCNNEFLIDVDENKTEVTCPECNNLIELDWSGNIDDEPDLQACNGSCHGCNGCDVDLDEQDEENDEEYYDEDYYDDM